jgi:hypothetical protein
MYCRWRSAASSAVRAHITGECSAMRVEAALPVPKRPTLACTRHFCGAEPFALGPAAPHLPSGRGSAPGLDWAALLLLDA